MANKIQILVIDADSLLRDGLCALLNSEEELQVIGAVGTTEAIARAAVPNPPDIAIVDIAVPDATGIEAITAIRTRWPQARVLVLTFDGDGRLLEQSLQAGADGYLLKSDTRQALDNALRSIKEGQRYVSPSIFDEVVHGYIRRHTFTRQHEFDGLSDRERDVMKRIARGQRTREIAHELSLSHKTVEKYRSNLMRKLGLKTATAVAAYAISHGYLEV
jgi:DNA-binding NarL/FixJ family response regulator